MTVRTRKIAALVVAILAVAFAAGTATVAQAFPNKTSACSNCHSRDAAVVVTATQTSNDGVNATYSISVSNTYGDGVTGWAIFDGATNIRNQYNAGTASVPVGKSYTVWGAAGSGGQGSNSVVISPIAPPPPPPPTDTIPPNVTITSPTDGATVSGPVALAAVATDNLSGVARVEFRIDGALVGTDSAAPYTGVWDASAAAAGTHLIQATAFDNAGLTTATSIQVSIAPPPPPVDTTAPFVTITSPTDGATVSGSVALSATATDDMSGVARVEFRIDGVLVGTDSAAPYTGVWDASAAAAGTHLIQATAFDNAGLTTATSIQVSITAPPVTSLSAVTISVVTQSGAPANTAKIVLKNVVTGIRYTAVTSTAGTAEFAALPYGTYSVTATGRGYKRATTTLFADAPTEALTVTLIAR